MSGDRLTKHIHDNYYTLDEKFGSLAIMKLGKIEDIEEKIGTSLEEIATPKKVKKATREDYMNSGYKHCCPNCGDMVGTITNNLNIKQDDYCPSCGQALDWSEEE